MSAPAVEIPFSFFVELVQAIAAIKPHKATERQPRSTRYAETPAYKTFKRWLTALRERYSPLPAGTTAIVFRWLFPEEDFRRKYGMQEMRLAQCLAKVFGVSTGCYGRGERLRNWQGEDAIGCLGNEVEQVLAGSTTEDVHCMSIAQVNALLAELAAMCAFSATTARPPPASRRSREVILAELYTSLNPTECAVVTQIILKDLRPLLYPVPASATHYTSALLQYKSNAVAMLSKEAAMHAWDPSGRFRVIFSTRANLEDAANAYEEFESGEGLPRATVGAQIQVGSIPKCVKGQGPAQSLKVLGGANKVWVETKYDGERAQIHVWLDDDGAPRIRIFSKSGRDSTMDRAGIHHVVYDALGIPKLDLTEDCLAPHELPFEKSIVVEAEMVAYSDALRRIDEFWRIRSLIARTAIGVRHKSPPPSPYSTQQEPMETQCSMLSNGSDGGTRHLALVFYDVLLLDGVSMLSMPYGERRTVLEKMINVKPGFAMLAERTCINMRHADAEERFRRVFARVIADHQEGVVIKADGAQYAERRWPWVKLKQDYIPGYGDTVDLVLLGASWEKERARELRVPPMAYTTFYFGALTNVDELKAHPTTSPHFDVIFTSSYGLTREQLEELNFMIKSSDPATSCITYSHNLCRSVSPPTVLLRQPLLAELFGAGFTKAPGSLVYELRFPRIAKVHRPSDRPWIDGTTLSELQQIARTAVGRDRPCKAEDDWARLMFCPDEPPSPGVRCPVKRKRTEDMWVERLVAVDCKVSPRGPTKRQRVEGATGRRVAQDVDDHNSENATLTGQTSDSPRQRVGMLRFGSVTNVASSSTRDVPLVASLLSETADNDPCTPENAQSSISTFTPVQTSLHLLSSQTTARPVEVAPSALPPTPRTPLHPRADVPTPSSAPPSVVTLHEFLRNSAVWFARPHDANRPAWRAPSHAVIPIGSNMNTLYAILMACGWAIRGVIFVDEAEGAWFTHILTELAQRRAAALRDGITHAWRPILLMSARMLGHDVLADTATKEEWEGRAICRFG
ncbi:hypothetical protein BD413DRAFT_646329 [Trametes elegans]|nr:hypothetical protein BD413DRAFT_646329 [Trametes elegans]